MEDWEYKILITYTEQMLNAPLEEEFFTIDWKYHKGLKASGWLRYRIVKEQKGEKIKYKIHETALRGYLSFIPRFIGGKGVTYNKIFWQELDADIERTCPSNTYDQALAKVNEMILFTYNVEQELYAETSAEIISHHPEDD